MEELNTDSVEMLKALLEADIEKFSLLVKNSME